MKYLSIEKGVLVYTWLLIALVFGCCGYISRSLISSHKEKRLELQIGTLYRYVDSVKNSRIDRKPDTIFIPEAMFIAVTDSTLEFNVPRQQ